MNHEERLIHVAKHGKEIRAALTILEKAGFALTQIETDFVEVKSAIDVYVPPNYPDAYRIREHALPVMDHLTGQRDLVPSVLHSPSSNGRIYTLTKGQRTILRDRYGMTPTKEVVLTEIATWPAAPTCVRHVIIKSTDYVPAHRKHLLNSAIIDDWVDFCQSSEQIDKTVDKVPDDDTSGKKPKEASFASLLQQYL